MSTDTLEKKPGISIADIKRIAAWGGGALLIGAIGFAHGTLFAHESAIAVIHSKQEAQIRAIDSQDRRFERIEALLQDMLKEMRK